MSRVDYWNEGSVSAPLVELIDSRRWRVFLDVVCEERGIVGHNAGRSDRKRRFHVALLVAHKQLHLRRRNEMRRMELFLSLNS